MTTRAATIGVIRADESYTLPEFKARTGLHDWALRAARNRGLKVVRVGNRGFIRGSDWLEYLELVSKSV